MTTAAAIRHSLRTYYTPGRAAALDAFLARFVGPGDLGRVIGRRGRTAQSIRTVVRAAATRDDTDVDIEFLDD